MANPQPNDAHLRIAHSINEQLMVSHFTELDRRMLDLILRLSWGCGKKDALIPHQRDFEVVGIGEGHIKQHLTWLIEAKVIVKEENLYSFNKDFDQWRVSRARGYTEQKLTELVSLNLNSNRAKLTKKGSGNLPKREEGAYQKGKFPTPELASPKESIKENIKKDIYIYLFNTWNEQGIIPHKKLTTDMKRAIDIALKDYSQEEIEQAMRNYAEIVKGAEYFFEYKWTLTEFLSRNKGNNIERFLDLEIAKSNFRGDKGNGKYKGNPSQKPAGAFSDIE